MAEPRPDAPHVVAPFARLLLKIFFRQVEVVGGETVPRQGPVIFVANHTNSLIDPALLLGFLARRPRFLAKSTLWRMAILRPFLWLAAAIPVYRRQDAVDTSRNVETFARCHEVLKAGGAIAIFPEGTSHNQPALVRLKTGVSRIVLEAEAKYGGLGIRLVPVGLVFDDKSRFRSRALVHVGEPLDVFREAELFSEDPERAVLELTDRVRQALGAVTLNYPSWEEALLIERAAGVFGRPDAELPAERRLSERFQLRQDFIAAYRDLERRHPEKVTRAAAAVADYEKALDVDQLTDAQVISKYPASGVFRFTLKSLWLLLVRMPLALAGTILNFLPYLAVDQAAHRGEKTRDVLATYKVIGSLVFYPLTWVLTAVAASFFFGSAGALAALIAGPVSGLVALRFHERREHFLNQARAFLLLRSGRAPIADLRRRRAEVLEMVRELAELHEA